MLYYSNPGCENLMLEREIRKAVSRVIKSGTYVLGENVIKFEREFGEYVGANHCVGVNSGTDAIVLGLRSLGIGNEDEVLVPSFTATASVSAIVESGAIPIFVDVNVDSYNMSIEDAISKITKRTKAILAVHLYGNPSDIFKFREICQKEGLFLIEDVAQAFGGKSRGQTLGSIGDLSCFSFYPTKNLGAIGDGGAVCTNDEGVAEKIREIRQYGWNPQRHSVTHGRNSRLDEIQAAILRVKLSHIEELNEERRQIAQEYFQLIKNSKIMLPISRIYDQHSFHLFVIRHISRSAAEIQAEFRRHGVEVGRHYPLPVHKMKAYSHFAKGELPNSEFLSDKVVSIPMYPGLRKREITQVSGIINDL